MEIMINAKDKAVDLWLMYYEMVDDIYSTDAAKKIAKGYALILVDEMIAELDSERVFERIYFWNEVKEEIIKL
jgi:hypothetical protein